MNLYLLTYEHVLHRSPNHWCYYIVADETAAKAQTRLEESDVVLSDSEQFRSAELLDDIDDSQVTFLAYTHKPVDFSTLE